MTCGVPLHKQPISFLTETETKYLKLLSAMTWNGVRFDSTHKKPAFKLVDKEYKDYQA